MFTPSLKSKLSREIIFSSLCTELYRFGWCSKFIRYIGTKQTFRTAYLDAKLQEMFETISDLKADYRKFPLRHHQPDGSIKNY